MREKREGDSGGDPQATAAPATAAKDSEEKREGDSEENRPTASQSKGGRLKKITPSKEEGVVPGVPASASAPSALEEQAEHLLDDIDSDKVPCVSASKEVPVEK